MYAHIVHNWLLKGFSLIGCPTYRLLGEKPLRLDFEGRLSGPFCRKFHQIVQRLPCNFRLKQPYHVEQAVNEEESSHQAVLPKNSKNTACA